MNCQRVSSLLSSYLDEMLPAREAGAVAGHLTRCAACRQELHALERAIAALDRVPPVTPPIDLWNRFQQRLARRPAALYAGGEPPTTGAARGRLVSGAGRRMPIGRQLAMAATILMAVATGGLGYRIALENGGARQSVLAGSLIARHHARVQAAEPSLSAVLSRSSRAATRRPRAQALILAPEVVIRSFESEGAAKRESTAGRPGPARSGSSAPNRRIAARASGASRGSGSSAADGQEHGAYAAKPGFGPPTGALEGSIPRLPLDEWAAENLGASAPVADALQAGIEETARQQVAEEVALLAQALTRAGAHWESAQ